MTVSELLEVVDSVTTVEIYKNGLPDEAYFNNRQQTIYKRQVKDLPTNILYWKVKLVRVVGQVLKVEVC